MTSTPRIRRCGVLCILAALALPSIAEHDQALAAPDEIRRVARPAGGAVPLQLEITIDGNPTNLVAEIFKSPDGRFSARRSELRELGIKAPGSGNDSDMIQMDSIPGLSMRFDEPGQKLHLTMPSDLRLAKDYAAEMDNGHVVREKVGISRDFGNVLNYNVFARAARGYTGQGRVFSTGAVSLENRTFSPFGVLTNSGVVGTTLAKDGYLRLDSSLTYADRDSSIIGTLGDAMSGGLNWTRPIRFGGAQINRQLGLRSDIITAPLPSVGGSAAVPSTVDVYVDNVRIARQEVGAGPFRLNNLPVPGESGTARVVVRDVTGKETETVVPFFTSSKLLAPGVIDFSLDGGVPRHNYALSSFDYSRKWFGMGSARYGLNDRLTLEAHAEGAAGLAAGGIGATIGGGAFGTFALAGAGSWHRGTPGGLVHASWQLGLRGIFLGASTQRTYGRYEDVASVTARPTGLNLSDNLADSGFYLLQRSARVARAVDRASLGMAFDRFNASLALSFVNIERADRDRSQLLNLTYSQTFNKTYNTFISAYTDFADRRSTGVVAGLSFPLGDTMTVSTAATLARDGREASLDIQRHMGQNEWDYSWRLHTREGEAMHRGGSAQVKTPFAKGSIGVTQDRATFGGHGEIEGALILAPSGVFASQRISDAFAIVDVGAPNVEVLQENRLVGRTDFRGMIVVPDMASFQRRKIAITPETLPGDVHPTITETDVIPGFRGSATLRMNSVSTNLGASVEIRDANGAHFPAGTRLKLQSNGHSFTIGYGGLTYLPEIADENTLIVQLPTSQCIAKFRRSDGVNSAGAIGPVRCVPQ